MKYTVITSFNQTGLNEYGQRMIDTFEQNWPGEVDLVIGAENCQPRTQRANTRVMDLLATRSDLTAFVQRHVNNPMAHGLAGPADKWNPKKAFRWDAVRFSYKVYTVAMCADMIDSGWMIWLDADSHTHTPVPMAWLPTVCPPEHMMCHLGRGEKYHSECGFVGYNLEHVNTRKFIADFVGLYNNDDIFNLDEWHDSYVWDVVRKQYQTDTANRFYNLNPHWQDKGLAGHPFINSSLGLYMDHVKGKRKEQGMSRAKEIIMHTDHPYWQGVINSRGKKI
jgi:hypothetical protein